MNIQINDYLDVTCEEKHCDFLHLYWEPACCGSCPLVQLIDKAIDIKFEVCF